MYACVYYTYMHMMKIYRYNVFVGSQLAIFICSDLVM